LAVSLKETKIEDGDDYLGWGMDVVVGLIQMIQLHLGILFRLNLLLDDEHASQEFDETESAMRAQVGILEQSVAQKMRKPIAKCQAVTTNLSHPVYSVKFSGSQTNCKTVNDLVMRS
jgi:hypothetical protein